MKRDPHQTIQMIPIDQITVVNPRVRAKSKFKQITGNIQKLGLKKPITVARRTNGDGVPRYDLVCGQGRLEAYRDLGQTEIPAIVIDATREELLLMSLVENFARRRSTSIDMLREIAALKTRGYTFAQIARKTDLDHTYVSGIVRLLKQGEERLLLAVERGQIPISVAIDIAAADDKEIQKFLTDAYESNTLRGHQLQHARRLIEARQLKGKALRSQAAVGAGTPSKSETLLRVYQKESERQREFVRKARLCEARLEFVVTALKTLLADENFRTLLRAESLDTLPQYLAGQLNGQGK